MSFRIAKIWIAALALAAGLSLRPAVADDSLYRDLGGRAGIIKIVDAAIGLWFADPRIKDQFDNINPDWFQKRLVDQFCELSGGPCHYKGRDMHAAHKGLHLGIAQFNALVEDLQTAMDKAGIPFWTQNRLVAILAPMEHQVVTQ
ncbi:MAG: group I truncated hemoglobin [Roseiarcus sp.]